MDAVLPILTKASSEPRPNRRHISQVPELGDQYPE